MGTLRYNLKLADEDQTFLVEDQEMTYNQRFSWSKKIVSNEGFVPVNLKAAFYPLGSQPEYSLCGASFSSSVNLNWGLGVLTGTAFGPAEVEGGKLDLRASEESHVTWSAEDNFGASGILQKGAIGFKFYPDYDGVEPVHTQILFNSFYDFLGNINKIMFFHSYDGFVLKVYDENAVLKATHIFGSFSCEKNAEYEILLCFDFESGATKLFLNKKQFGSILDLSFTRTGTAPYFRIGGLNAATVRIPKFRIDDLILYNRPPYWYDYTSDYEVPDSILVQPAPIKLLSIHTDAPIVVYEESKEYIVSKEMLLTDGIYITGIKKHGVGEANVKIKAFGETE